MGTMGEESATGAEKIEAYEAENTLTIGGLAGNFVGEGGNPRR